MELTDEFNSYLSSIKTLKELSKRTYTNHYKKVRKGVGEDLAETDQENIIDYLNGLSDDGCSINSYLNYLSMSINVRRHHKADTSELDRMRNTLIERKENNKQANNRAIIESGLPTIGEIESHLDLAWNEGRWRDYVILYLLIKFHTRNKDIDVAIVTDIKLAKNDNINFLVAKPTHINFIRNNYKTKEKYGRKSFSIKNRRFMGAVANYLAEVEDSGDKYIWLLADKNNNHIKNDSIQKFISRVTINGVGQTIYNKVYVTYSVKSCDVALLKSISERRGTSVAMLLSAYDLSPPGS
tara:strand:- start:735 stop:1625 length:891 start_codon:yes stop_codon:yes gene_type:complete